MGNKVRIYRKNGKVPQRRYLIMSTASSDNLSQQWLL